MPEGEPLQPGDPARLGEYRLRRRLGAGGQGIVYLGEAPSGEPVAVKLLHARLTGQSRARDYFAKELAAARHVDPFCTARILAADVEGDVPYIVSEYIAGLSLKHSVERHGPHTGPALYRLAVGTASALTAIHQAGIVHRDFKPSNVLLGPDGPRVIDFGVARLLDAQASFSGPSAGVVGTPAYMAPEQLSGGELTPAVDVFAWAATLVYASCGRPPFGLDSIPVVITRILNEAPDLGALEGRLRQLALQCLAKNPNLRPTSDDVLMRLHQSETRAVRALPTSQPAGPQRIAPPPAGPQPPAAEPPRTSGPLPQVGTGPVPPGGPGPAPQRSPGPAGMPRPIREGPQRTSPSAERPLVVISGSGDAADTTTGGGLGVHDTSGIQVRIGSRGARRARHTDGGSGRGGGGRTRMLVVAAAALAVVAVAGIWVGLLGGSGDSGGNTGSGAKAPRTGSAVEVSTTDGFRYRMAAVGQGVTSQGQASPGTEYAYADYVLTNPSDVPVLLDLYAVDVFLKRNLIPQAAQGRCMWQNGVPEDMCTPPTRSQITRQLEGGPPTDGANGGKYMPPGASYVVRVTVDVPMNARPQAGQLRLYVWKQLYIADALAKEVPFPRS